MGSCSKHILEGEGRQQEQQGAAYLQVIHGMLEGAVCVSALAISDKVAADRHPGSVKLVEEPAVFAFHAQALEPVSADRLQDVTLCQQSERREQGAAAGWAQAGCITWRKWRPDVLAVLSTTARALPCSSGRGLEGWGCTGLTPPACWVGKVSSKSKLMSSSIANVEVLLAQTQLPACCSPADPGLIETLCAECALHG